MSSNQKHLDHYSSFQIIVESIRKLKSLDSDSPIRSYYTDTKIYEVKLANYKKEEVNIPKKLKQEIQHIDIPSDAVVILNRLSITNAEDIDNVISFLKGLKNKIHKQKEND